MSKIEARATTGGSLKIVFRSVILGVFRIQILKLVNENDMNIA
jgi:hypothetical protein